ncbi:response regulator [Algoriphagus aestuarii]|nr:response regulator [Algoriphagus aestuarii]
MKVLFIDDEYLERVRFSETVKLLNLDVDVLVAENGWDAIALLGNVKNLPDIIVHDINMPDLNGIELLNKLKNVEVIRRIPKITFTSSKNKTDLRQCWDLGVNSIIIKPFKPEDYQETIKLMISYWKINANSF